MVMYTEVLQQVAEAGSPAVGCAFPRGGGMAIAPSEQALSQNRMERIKVERHPLEVLADLERYARQGWEAIPADDLERLKWYGLFHRHKAPGTFMLRVRVPGGILQAHQLRALADLAEEVGRGRADLTTRQNVQRR